MNLKLNNKHDGAIPTYGINAMSSMVTTIGAPSLPFYQYPLSGAWQGQLKIIFMKHCKYLLLMLMAVLVFASFEKEEDETSGFSKYLRMKINSCERFGDVLRIDFTMTNVSGKDLEDIEFSGVSVVDNNGDEYSDLTNSAGYVSFNDGFKKNYLKVSIDKKDEINGAFFINNFKPSSVKSVDLKFSADLGSDKFNGTVKDFKKIKVEDNRVMRNGIQTNDKALEFKVTSCTRTSTGDCILSMNLKNVSEENKNITNFSIGEANNGNSFEDNQGNGYFWYNVDVSVNGGNWKDYRVYDLSLYAGESMTVKFRIPNFSRTATSLSGVIGVNSDVYPFTGNVAKVMSVEVE